MVINQNRINVIYNPQAGKKRKILPNQIITSLEEIKELLKQYQIIADYSPTKFAGDAQNLAHEAVKKGYKTVVAAGGDGTVGEVGSGLINTDTSLGILPLGSFMNIAKMLSIPNDLEKAVSLLKINRTRKIDVGVITKLSGEKVDNPFYFLEGAGIGLEAELHEHIIEWEKGSWLAIFRMFKTFLSWYGHNPEIILDDKKIKEWTNMVSVTNGPLGGANLPLGPKAKLNDHYLTVNTYKMSKFELFSYFLKAILGIKNKGRVKTYKSKKIQIITKNKRLVHADGRLFGHTPVEFKIIPNALNVITGFPKDSSALERRTYLDP